MNIKPELLLITWDWREYLYIYAAWFLLSQKCISWFFLQQVFSHFQGRTRGIPGSNSRGNNAWSVHMHLRISRINRPPLMGRKPVQKQKQSIFSLHSTRKLTKILTEILSISAKKKLYFFWRKKNYIYLITNIPTFRVRLPVIFIVLLFFWRS